MGTPLKPAEAVERLFPATQPEGTHRVEPLPTAASPVPANPQFRRAFPRIPCRVLVDYVVDGKAYRDCIANISEGGAFIETCHPLRVGRPITLSFTLFQDQQPLRVVGEVAWSNGTGAGVRLQPNAVIGKFCSDQSGVADPLVEDLEEPVPSPEPPAPVSVQEASPRDHRRTGSISAAIVPSIALIIVAMMGILARYDARADFSILDAKVERLSQNWARVEAAVARHLLDPARAVQSPITAQPAAQSPNAAPARQSPAASPAPASQPIAPTSSTATQVSQSSNPPANGETVYVVQPGDTLFRIGMKFNLSTKALLDFNQLATADLIYVGQRIRLPAVNNR